MELAIRFFGVARALGATDSLDSVYDYAECAGEAVATGSCGVTFAVGVGMGFLAEALYRRAFDKPGSM